ncbi:hypothetical protein V8G54_019648 [Vigna mungo]|uniref:Uncharacterized protein n=1 Tax=Vigna mungo TaxID=3915 RepID=A0AAQ3RTZ0_VIGMU
MLQPLFMPLKGRFAGKCIICDYLHNFCICKYMCGRNKISIDLRSYHLVSYFSVYHISIINDTSTLRKILNLSPWCEHKDTTTQQIPCNSIHKFPRTHVANKLFLPLSNCIQPANSESNVGVVKTNRLPS